MQTYSDGLRTKTKMKSFQAWYFYCWLFFCQCGFVVELHMYLSISIYPKMMRNAWKYRPVVFMLCKYLYNEMDLLGMRFCCSLCEFPFIANSFCYGIEYPVVQWIFAHSNCLHSNTLQLLAPYFSPHRRHLHAHCSQFSKNYLTAEFGWNISSFPKWYFPYPFSHSYRFRSDAMPHRNAWKNIICRNKRQIITPTRSDISISESQK